MKEFLIKYRIDTIWHSRGGEITSNYYTEAVCADSGKMAINKIFNEYSSLLRIPTKDLEILSVKLIS